MSIVCHWEDWSNSVLSITQRGSSREIQHLKSVFSTLKTKLLPCFRITLITKLNIEARHILLFKYQYPNCIQLKTQLLFMRLVLIATYSSNIASMLLSISSSLIPIYVRVMEGISTMMTSARIISASGKAAF